MPNLTVNKLRKVYYRAENDVTGITDFVVAITKPDDTAFTPAPTVTEVGSGIYTFSYTPNVAGLWRERISSVSNADDYVQVVEIQFFDLNDIKTQLDTIETSIPGNKKGKFLN